MANALPFQISATDLKDPKCQRLNSLMNILQGQINDLKAAVAQSAADNPASISLSATANADLTLSDSFTGIPGASTILNRLGTWLVLGTFAFDITSADGEAFGSLFADQIQNQQAILSTPTASPDTTATVAQYWLITVSQSQNGGNLPIQLQGMKNGGGGTGVCRQQSTGLLAIWLHP